MSIVDVSHVRKAFGPVKAVEDVSFEVAEGEIFGLLGPNGAGKTTTIRMMLDIFRPDGGAITVFGGPWGEETKNRVGYLPEERGLYKDQPLDQVLIYLAALKGLSRAGAQARLGPWLERLDLAEHRSKKVQELSRGMQQKAQVIATLIHEPDLIVIDEPFSGLDPVNTRLVKAIIEEQRQAGKTIIMSTHQMHQVEALCTRIVLINRGRTVLHGQVREIKQQYAGNAVLIHGRGDFSGLPGVIEMRQQNDGWHLNLGAGSDPKALLQALANRPDAYVERFELAQPSLEDIFVRVVQGEAAAEAGDDHGQ